MNPNKKERLARFSLRVSPEEKMKLESYAEYCGLTLSEYLRQRGLGYTPRPRLDEEFYNAYTKLCEISNLPLTSETEAVLIAVLNDLRQNLFLPKKQTKKEIVKEVKASLQQDSGRSKED